MCFRRFAAIERKPRESSNVAMDENSPEVQDEIPGDRGMNENPDEDAKSKISPESKDGVFENQGAEVEFSVPPKPSNGVSENTNRRDKYLVPIDV